MEEELRFMNTGAEETHWQQPLVAWPDGCQAARHCHSFVRGVGHMVVDGLHIC